MAEITRRQLIGTLGIVLALTGVNILLNWNSPPSSWVRTEKYGFSFMHPNGYRWTSNTPTSWIPGYWDGGIQGTQPSGESDILGFYWITGKSDSSVEALTYIIQVARAEGMKMWIDDLEVKEVGGFDWSLTSLEVELGGASLQGAICVFPTKEGRYFIVYYISGQLSHQHTLRMLEMVVSSMEINPPIIPR